MWLKMKKGLYRPLAFILKGRLPHLKTIEANQIEIDRRKNEIKASNAAKLVRPITKTKKKKTST